jgi:hypothetical protein
MYILVLSLILILLVFTTNNEQFKGRGGGSSRGSSRGSSGGSSGVSSSSRNITGSSPQCFAGSQKVLLNNWEYKLISEISVGDKILTCDKNYNFSFSSIIFLPHAKNNIETEFIQITSNKNKIIKLTPEHSIIANNKVVFASDVKLGDELITINGTEKIIDISFVKDYGVYTAITDNEFIVVNDIIASPIAYILHENGTKFYNFLKNIYKLSPYTSNNIHNFAHNTFDSIYHLTNI